MEVKNTLKASYNSLDKIVGNFSRYKILKEVEKNDPMEFSKHSPNQTAEDFKPKMNISIRENVTTSKKEYPLLEELAKGAFKKALHMGPGKVLIVPNREFELVETFLEHWERMVDEEVKMDEVLQKLGLLCPKYKKVEILPSEELPSVPGYISKSFNELALKKGIFVIDVNNISSLACWEKCSPWLFTSVEEQFKEENWFVILEPLVEDLVTLVRHKISLHRDSFNFAVVKGEKTSQYALRYFGFDFSQKDCAMTVPDLEKEGRTCFKLDEYEITLLEDRAEYVISKIFEGMFAQFKEPLLLEKVPVLKKKVSEWFCKAVMEDIKK